MKNDSKKQSIVTVLWRKNELKHNLGDQPSVTSQRALITAGCSALYRKACGRFNRASFTHKAQNTAYFVSDCKR